MSENITRDEAAGRLHLAADAYKGWSNEDLWDEYCTCTEQATIDTDPNQREIEWAIREALGLALIGRGLTAAQLDNVFCDPFRESPFYGSPR